MHWKFKPWTEPSKLARSPQLMPARPRHRGRCLGAAMALLLLAGLLGPEVATAQVNRRGTVKLLVKKAEEARKSGGFAAAAVIWLQVYVQAPQQPMSLYNAALMEEKAGQLDAAAKHLREFLSVTTKQHPRHTLARVRLQSVTAQADAAAKTKLAERLLAERRAKEARAATSGVSRSGAAKSGASKSGASKSGASKSGAAESAGSTGINAKGPASWPAWAAVAVGGGLVAAAAGLYLGGVAENNRVVADKKAGKLSYAAAKIQVDELAANDVIYGVLGGVGLVGVGVGAYLLLTRPASAVAVAPWPNGRGAVVAVRF